MGTELIWRDPAGARALSEELRTSGDPRIRRRRGIIGLALAAAGAMGVIALYQTGIIRHLPEPPIRGLDADKVDAASEAYQGLSMPDGVLGLFSYAATAALASIGGADRARTHRWVPLALAAKLGLDAAVAGKLTVDQWTKHRAFCSYCLAAAATTFAAVPLAIPETRDALRGA